MIKLEDLIETKIFNNLFSMNQVDENEIKNFLKNPTTVYLNQPYFKLIVKMNLLNYLRYQNILKSPLLTLTILG